MTRRHGSSHFGKVRCAPGGTHIPNRPVTELRDTAGVYSLLKTRTFTRPGDEMDEINFDVALEKTEIDREEAIRRILNGALKEEPMLDGKGNRICYDCEAVIPAKRIEAVPNAVRCVECQSIAEKATEAV
jgi:DnaK suppressor protein